MKRLIETVAASIAVCLPLLAAPPVRAATSTIHVVAAENFYGELVRELGGPHVSVTSILSNPDQDPHLFEASPKTARALAAAQLVVYNGADYDPWLPKLLAASRATQPQRTKIIAAELVGKKPGDNPHLWYLPRTMPAVAHAVSAFLMQADPANKADYDTRLTQFIDSLKPIDEKIAALKQRYQGVPVTATEPVFGYMADAIGLTMRNQRFQLSTMNETEPSATDIAALERDLKTRQPGKRHIDPPAAEDRATVARAGRARHRNAAAQQDVPAMDARAARRTGKGIARTDSMSDPAIEFDRVTLELGGRRILDDVSFSVDGGQFVGVLGPNGAGKTTLMRALLGLVPLAAGRLHALGQPVTRGNPAIGYMPQVRSTPAARRVSGRNFVACAVDGHRWGITLARGGTRRAVDKALSIVGASALAERPLAELSGGERQRLLLAQCLLGQPRLLLLDEPLISLDPSHQSGVVALVRQIQREFGITVLFTAHELNPLLNAIDRVLYLGSGRAALGTVDEVITPPILSRLYGAPIDVMRLAGRIFVMSGGVEIEKHDHAHEDDADLGHGHEHAQDHGHDHASHQRGLARSGARDA
ncbi:hypothetical protein DFQ28_010286 [Apophysomyces sp. BC1034]|nr:hypothetical protein DFQ28_010286 [Apophysomyces sp. BC1034]